MESTQDRIVAAARGLFGEYGFHKTTTAEIARTAGVAEGTIYRYFKDKRELLIACVEPAIQEVVRRETGVIHGVNAREILRNRIIERVRVIREHLPVFSVLFCEGRYHPEIARILVDQIMTSIPTSEWERLSHATNSGALKRQFNPLIMHVGLTAAIWAMITVGPLSDQIFADWPSPSQYDRLEEDLADFVCAALMGDEQ